MARLRVHKTSFAAGEVSPLLLGRRDLRAFDNGAAALRNVFVHPEGGVSRRPGLRYVDMANGPGRLVAFEFNTEQVYLMVFSHQLLQVFRDGVRVSDLAAPWTEDQIRQINWTQSADTLLVVHPDVPPKSITRSLGEVWAISDWHFHTENNRIHSPHNKYFDETVTVQPSALSGQITVTASSDVFSADYIGLRLRIGNKEIQVSGYVSPSVVNADVKETLSSTAETTDWSEEAYSPIRGWPVSIGFHQDRLVIGGSRDLPNRLWLSKSGNIYNFDLGEGLDDESIEFPILSDQVNAIRNVFSGRHLQVFTSGAEWMVTGDPLTPTNIQVRRQTRIGSPSDRTIPPRDVDGATVFISRTGGEIREFLFTDTEQAYQAADLSLLAHHLIRDPVDMDLDHSRRLLHVVMDDGTIATLTVYREEQVNAWSLQETEGRCLSVVSVGLETYVLVERANGYTIEVFDGDMYVDSALNGTSATETAIWSGLDHLEGQSVKVIADDAVFPDETVNEGQIALGAPARRLQAGLSFRHLIKPLPIAPSGASGSQGGKIRLISLTCRLWQSAALHLDVGYGIIEVPIRRFGADTFDSMPEPFTGDKTVRGLGWRADGTKPLWRLEQDVPLPFTLLSVSTEISVNG